MVAICLLTEARVKVFNFHNRFNPVQRNTLFNVSVTNWYKALRNHPCKTLINQFYSVDDSKSKHIAVTYCYGLKSTLEFSCWHLCRNRKDQAPYDIRLYPIEDKSLCIPIA